MSGNMMVPWKRAMRMSLLFVVMFVVLSLHASAVTSRADSDGDGLGDDLERVLGTNPARAEVYKNVIKRKVPAGFADPARFITGVAVANAGENRFVWRVTFGDVYPTKTSLVQLYVDIDNDRSTGRAGRHGCEYMLKIVKGRAKIKAFSRDHRTVIPKSRPYVVVAGSSVYLAFDVPLPPGTDAFTHRLQVSSGRLDSRKKLKSVDTIKYFVAFGPPMSVSPKCRRDADLTESIGVAQTFGPRFVDPLVSDKTTVRTDRKAWELDGFRVDVDKSEYRADNVVRTAENAKIVVKPGVSGTFFPGFVIHDEGARTPSKFRRHPDFKNLIIHAEGAREIVEFRLNGKRLGVAVAAYDDNDQHLFYVTKPVQFSPTDRLELRTLSPHGRYRIEDIVLLRKAPVPRDPVYEFSYVETTEDRLTWISSWAVACTVDIEPGEPITESGAVNNHRVTIPNLQPGKSVRYRITGTRPDGQSVTSAWISYTRPIFVEPKTTASGTISLKIIDGIGKLPVGTWPVTCGVPFPKGKLGSERNVVLTDRAGRTVLLQTEVTSRWPDGSIRWLLLDFRHSGDSRDYVLAYGPKHVRTVIAPPVVPAPSLGTLVLTDMQGRVHRQKIGPFKEILRGTLRCEFRSRGTINDANGTALYGYDVRVHSFPGTPWLRVHLSYGNCFKKKEFLTIRSLNWELPAAKGKPVWVRQHTDDKFESSAGKGKRFSGATGSVFIRDFWQNYPKDVKVTSTGTTVGLMPPLKANEYDWANGTVDEHRLFYWFDTGGYKLRQGMTKTQDIWIGTDGSSPLLDRPLFVVATPEWYQHCGVFGGNYAIAGPNKTVVEEYDRHVGEAMSTFLQNREKNREYGQFNFGDWWGERGANWGNVEYDTQHAFLLHFVRTGDPRFFLAADEAEVHNRDIDTVHYHCDVNRLGGVYKHCIGHVGNYGKGPKKGRKRGSRRGAFCKTHTWAAGHIDHYFLTGDRRSLETAKSIVDRHIRYGTINYDFHNTRSAGWPLILSMAMFRATRDPYYLNASRIIVNRVLERQTPEAADSSVPGGAGGGWRRMLAPGHCRCKAHHGNTSFMVSVLMTGLRKYHQETGDPAVLDSICRAARFVIEDMWLPKFKGFRYTSCPKSSKHSSFSLPLFDGISYAYRLRPDPLLAKIMTVGTNHALSGMKSSSVQGLSRVIRDAPYCLDVLQQLRDNPAVLSADISLRTPQVLAGAAKTVFDAAGSRIPRGAHAEFAWDFGDGTAATGCKVTHGYRDAGRYSVRLVVRAGEWVNESVAMVSIPPAIALNASRARSVLVEAEDFTAQGGGQVKIVAEGRVNTSRAIVTRWANKGHWLEWSVTPPRPGLYHLIFKYATNSKDTRRDIRLNGTVPAHGKLIMFPKTGGWCKASDDWNYLVLGGATPVALNLGAGKTTIRMSNLGDGLALDWLLLVPANGSTR